MIELKSRAWIKSASRAELAVYLHHLLGQYERNNTEILRLVRSIRHAHDEIVDAMEEIEMDQLALIEPSPPEPRRSGWLELGLAGLVGYSLGGGFSRRE